MRCACTAVVFFFFSHISLFIVPCSTRQDFSRDDLTPPVLETQGVGGAVKGAARNIVFGNGDERDGGEIDDGGAEVRTLMALLNHTHAARHTHTLARTHIQTLVVPAASQTSLSLPREERKRKKKNAAPSPLHLHPTESSQSSPLHHANPSLNLRSRRCSSASARRVLASSR